MFQRQMTINNVLDSFKKFKVTREDIELKFKKTMESFDEADFVEIRKFYSELKSQKKAKEEVTE